MRFLFLGDIVGFAGCEKLKKNLPEIIIKKKIDFVVVNGENSFDSGVGITENIMSEILSSGVDVITTGNHIWDQKETYNFIKNEVSYWFLNFCNIFCSQNPPTSTTTTFW